MASRSSDSGGSSIYPDEYKVIIIGAVGVGKTSLLIRYVHNEFSDTVTKFVSEEKKNVIINGKEMVLQLWDTAGQERYNSLTRSFFTDVEGIMLVYDETDSNTFQDLERFWLPDAISHTQRISPHMHAVPMIIVANKSDCSEDRAVLFQDAVDLSRNRHLLHPIQCSAKTGSSVDKAFEQLATEMQRMQPGTHITKEPHVGSMPGKKKWLCICL